VAKLLRLFGLDPVEGRSGDVVVEPAGELEDRPKARNRWSSCPRFDMTTRNSGGNRTIGIVALDTVARRCLSNRMGEHRRAPITSRRLIPVLVALCAAFVLPNARAGAPVPAVTYYTDSGVSVISLDGEQLAAFNDFQFISLDGNVFAGSRHLPDGGLGEFIRAVDVVSGERLFRIKDAVAPVVVAGGRKIGFIPDRFGHRDRYFASVWVRNAHGRERKLVQFTGPERTTRTTGFHGEGIPLDYAWDDRGRTVAVTFGDDVDLFIYDVWVVDVKTREADRMTKGKVSRFPSLSPSGERLAVVRERDHCGGPGPGFRAGNIRTMLSDGSEKTTLLHGDCALFYTDPRWISEEVLVAGRLTLESPGEYLVDVVEVNATTGVVTELISGDVTFFTASAQLQKISFVRAGVSGFFVYDIATGKVSRFPEGVIPQLSGVHRLV
jgi:hypothetical protein